MLITSTVSTAAVSKVYQDAAVRDRRVEATTKLSQAELAAVEKSERATSRRPRGDKDRPCLVVALVTTLEDGTPIVRVLPITPSPPGRTHEAIEIPPADQVPPRPR